MVEINKYRTENIEIFLHSRHSISFIGSEEPQISMQEMHTNLIFVSVIKFRVYSYL